MTNRDATSRALAAIQGAFKKSSVRRLSEGTTAEVREVIPTGIDVLDNWVFGCGGIPVGRFIEIYSAPDVGKTATLLHMMAAAQRAGGLAILFESENTLQKSRAQFFGVDLENALISERASTEDFLGQMAAAMKAIPDDVGPNLIGWDSIAMTAMESQYDNIDASVMGKKAALMSARLPVLARLASEKRCAVILLNQSRCVTPDALVLTQRGLVSAGTVTHLDEIATHRNVYAPVAATAVSTSACVRIGTRFGYEITCGVRHPMWAVKDGRVGWVQAAEIDTATWVQLSRGAALADTPQAHVLCQPETGDPRCKPFTYPAAVTDEFCAFLGTWFADGALIPDHGVLAYTEKSDERRHIVQHLLTNLFGRCSTTESAVYLHAVPVVNALAALGLQQGARSKTVPSCVKTRSQWRAFLRHMFDTHPSKCGFVLTSENEAAARQIHTVLLTFGVVGSLRRTPQNTWHIHITGRDALRYVEQVGFAETNKAARVEAAASGSEAASSRGKLDVIPVSCATVARVVDALATAGGSRRRVFENATYNRINTFLYNAGATSLSRADAYAILTLCRTHEIENDDVAALREMARPGFVWLPVTSVSDAGTIDCVDFDVPGDCSFLANGFVTHNTKLGVAFGDPTTTPGGDTHKFLASTRLQLWRSKQYERNGAPAGHYVTVKATKSKTTKYGKKVKLRLDYDHGWDNEWSVIDLAKELDLIPATSKPSAATLKDAYTALEQHPEWYTPTKPPIDEEAPVTLPLPSTGKRKPKRNT